MKNLFLNVLDSQPGLRLGLRRGLLLALLMLAWAGCTQQESVPENILPQHKMVSIITDVHELEAKIGLLKLDNDSSTALFNEKQTLLMDKHGVSYSDYTRSYDYYLSRIELMNKIYEAVVDSLSLRRNMESSNKEEDTGEEPI